MNAFFEVHASHHKGVHHRRRVEILTRVMAAALIVIGLLTPHDMHASDMRWSSLLTFSITLHIAAFLAVVASFIPLLLIFLDCCANVTHPPVRRALLPSTCCAVAAIAATTLLFLNPFQLACLRERTSVIPELSRGFVVSYLPCLSFFFFAEWMMVLSFGAWLGLLPCVSTIDLGATILV